MCLLPGDSNVENGLGGKGKRKTEKRKRCGVSHFEMSANTPALPLLSAPRVETRKCSVPSVFVRGAVTMTLCRGIIQDSSFF